MTRPDPAAGHASPPGRVRLDRRSLLALMSASATSTLTGCTADRSPQTDPSLPSSASTSVPGSGATSSEEPAIFDLSFTLASRFRPFELVSAPFAAVSREASTVGELEIAETGPPAPYAAVELDVRTAGGTLVAGLAAGPEGAGTQVLGSYDSVKGRVAIEVSVEGRTTTVRSVRKQLPRRFRMGVAICENQVTVLADTGHGWRPLVTEREEVATRVDLRRPAVLEELRYAWGARGGSGEAASEARTAVRAGLFGMTGLRDLHLVQDADGTPYTRNGKTYLSATCAGLGFFNQAHWGIFRIDLADPTHLEQAAHLFFSRDGLLLGDHAGQVVRDHDRWHVATSSWGDFAFQGVQVRHLSTTEDVLHGVHVLESEPTPLPTSDASWDPGMTRIDRRWHVSFVESPSQDPFDFHPALAVGPPGGELWEGLELVGAAEELRHCEGPILAEVDGRWWFLASDGDSRAYPVFDLQMQRLGRLDAPYKTNIPHPQLVPLPEGGHLMVTFDSTQFAPRVMGYGGHGDVLVMRSRDAGR